MGIGLGLKQCLFVVLFCHGEKIALLELLW